MADAMDWHPTTPPPIHNPYSHPQYMPGGWPASPPPFQHTTGVFARKREAGTIERATKRVCAGVKTVGTYAALPAKPLYIIVRRWRSQEHQTPGRRGRRSPAQSRRIPAGTRARIAAAEQNLVTQETQYSPQQIATPPATPPRTPLITQDQQNLEHASVVSITSATNTETPISAKNVDKRVSKTTTPSGVKRSKTDTESEDSPNICLQYSTLSSYLAAQSSGTQSTPAPARDLPAKKMKKVNHFDANYKRSPTAYAARGLTRKTTLKPIGTKVEDESKTDSIWGPWQHEKPLSLRYQEPTPDKQLQSELDFHVSELSDSAVEPEVDQSENAPDPPTEDVGPVAPATLLPLHDERWACSALLEQFFPDNFAKPEEDTMGQARPESANLTSAVSADPSTVVVERLFHDTKPKHTPPPIKRHATRLVAQLRSAKPQESGNSSADDENIDNTKTTRQDDTSTAIKLEVDARSPNREIPEDLPLSEGNAAGTGSEAKTAADSISAAPVPITPMKVAAEKPATEATETPVYSATSEVLETPAQKFSKLSVKDDEDKDTPKATPHSGTKTTRVTRYREALEKAQRAKLQQYELVPITNEWDQKVRAAIRHGIPDYLGPHDLARVVPQYAQRGQDNWLNDETINKYLDLVAAHGRKNDRPDQVKSHHAFNNFFYNNLNKKGAKSVLSWSKRAKIGGKNLAYVEKVFVPINSGAHWTLAVVEPTQKKITHYNSMRGSGIGIRACNDLMEWVALELGKDFKEEEWTLVAVGESPQQTNSDDCGVFTITSARQIMLGYTPMSYGPEQIPIQRIRIVAELINRALLKSTGE